MLRLPDGHPLYSDKHQSSGQNDFAAVSLDGAVLHLRYVRGYDGSCSILKNGAACWDKIMQEGHFVRAVASQPPPVAACVASYRAGQRPAGDASTVTYEVEMTLTIEGKAAVLHRGAPGCQPGP